GRQAHQLLADLRGLLSVIRGRIGDHADGCDVAVDLFGYRALLLGSRGDLSVHVIDGADFTGDHVQALGYLGDAVRTGVRLDLSTFHGLDRIAHAVLQLLDSGLDFLRGLLCA